MLNTQIHTNKRTGKPKIIYKTENSANKAVWQMKWKYKGYYICYKCDNCDGYHITRIATKKYKNERRNL